MEKSMFFDVRHAVESLNERQPTRSSRIHVEKERTPLLHISRYGGADTTPKTFTTYPLCTGHTPLLHVLGLDGNVGEVTLEQGEFRKGQSHRYESLTFRLTTPVPLRDGIVAPRLRVTFLAKDESVPVIDVTYESPTFPTWRVDHSLAELLPPELFVKNPGYLRFSRPQKF